jgi:uncharacterized protein
MYMKHLALALCALLPLVTPADLPHKGGIPNLQLLQASQNNDTQLAQKLLKLGINPNIRTISGLTPLMFASYHGSTAITRLLLGYRADVNLSTFANQELNLGKLLSHNNKGTTALMLAAYAGRIDIVIILLKSGAQVNAQDSDGQTALTYAILGDRQWPHQPLDETRKKIIQILLDFGANPHSLDANGLDAAYFYGCIAGLVPGFANRYDYDQSVAEADPLYHKMR